MSADDGMREYDGPPTAAVAVDRDLEVLAHRPEAVVVGVVERLEPRRRRAGRTAAATPPRRPCSLIHLTSSIASSMSLTKIWPMPARRSGNWPQKSSSQRLCARTPARRCSYSSGFGGAREQHEAREERRHGVREDDLADDAVGVLLAVAHLVVPVAQAAVVAEVLERVLVLAAPRVEVVEVLLLEELAVLRVAAAGVRVGRDDRVPGVLAVRGARTHVRLRPSPSPSPSSPSRVRLRSSSEETRLQFQ